MLARDFSSCHFVYVCRSTNQIVNVLAKESVFMPGLLERAYPSPTLIFYVIIAHLV